MNEEQKAIAKRLGVVTGILLVVIVIVYFIYSPGGASTNPSKVFGGGAQSIIAVFRSGTWYVDTNANGQFDPGKDFTLATGKAGDVPIAGTWDLADGPSVGSYANGVFTLVIGGKTQAFSFGGTGDIPVVGDWNGDGRTKVGVFRQGFWRLDFNGNGKWDGVGVDKQIALGGVAGEIPVPGDWNGDGKTDIGVYRPDGSFALDVNGSLGWDLDDKICFIGRAGDIPLVGDWNGDGRSKVGVYHNGFWTLDYDGNQKLESPALNKDRYPALGGVPGEIPVIGDWNGDGKTKIGVYRQTQWFIDSDGNFSYTKEDKMQNFGLTGDIPMVVTPSRKKK